MKYQQFLYNLRINSPDGNFVKLGDVAEIKNRLSFLQ